MLKLMVVILQQYCIIWMGNVLRYIAAKRGNFVSFFKDIGFFRSDWSAFGLSNGMTPNSGKFIY